MDPELDFLEWHDAHLDRIVRNGTDVRLEFTDVPVYRKVGPGLWEAEIGPVVLVLIGAQVDSNPPGDERTEDSGWVMACTRSEPMARNDIQGFGQGVGPGIIAFEMVDCSTVTATFQHAQLTIVGPLEKCGRQFEGTRPEM